MAPRQADAKGVATGTPHRAQPVAQPTSQQQAGPWPSNQQQAEPRPSNLQQADPWPSNLPTLQ